MKKKVFMIIVFLIAFLIFFIFVILPFGKENKLGNDSNGKNQVQREETKEIKEKDETEKEKRAKHKEELNNKKDEQSLIDGKETVKYGATFFAGGVNHYYEYTFLKNGILYLYIQDGTSKAEEAEKGYYRYYDENNKNKFIIFANESRYEAERLNDHEIKIDNVIYSKIDMNERTDV